MTRIVVLGAGAIGCYVGGRLVAAGCEATFIGRPPAGDAIAKTGLTLSDYQDRRAYIAPDDIEWSSTPEVLAAADIILVCVKSGGTEEAARQIAEHAPEDVTVVSLQNGVSNEKVLQAYCGSRPVLGGMVAFNVVSPKTGHFHQSTEGKVIIEHGEKSAWLVERLNAAGIDAGETGDIKGVKWGKLLLNLNNGLNVLSGVPLVEQLQDRDYRAVLAAAMEETFAVLKKAGITPAAISAARPSVIPRILNLPNWLFRIVAARMLAMDKSARSSMWDDLQRGRVPEIDELNGAVVGLGNSIGISTPVNTGIVLAVKNAFLSGNSPCLKGSELRRLLNI